MFIHEYLQCWNAAEAARRAGYSEKTARQIGAENLTKPDIRAAIDERMRLLAMSADEALFRLSQHARGSMEDFVDVETNTIDLNKADKAGKLHLVKKFTHTKTDKSENISVELYDAQSALNSILKELHLRSGEPTERTETSAKVEHAIQEDTVEQLSAVLQILNDVGAFDPPSDTSGADTENE